jgi:hypothetical protein
VLNKCSDLTTPLKSFVETHLSGIKNLTATVYNNHCIAAADGCSCDYDVQLVTKSSGPWAAAGSVISFYDDTAQPPAPADFCASGSTLSLTGSQSGDLFNRTSLKTLALHPPSCDDRVQSKSLGETGIDCGGSCPKACP